MYGLVNKAVEGLICSRFGEETWERIKAKAGVDVDAFISNDGYPDETTYKLVGAASEVLGMPAAAVLEAFGEYWITHTSREGYGHLMDAGGRTLPEFLENLPNFHARVTLIFPKLEPPSFKVSDRTADSLRLHYYSHRQGLAPFVTGLLRGLGIMFKTGIESSIVSSRETGNDHDVFLVRWKPAET
jgi:hypothetical protein